MVILALGHVVLILAIPWTTKWVPGLVSIPFGVADLILMLTILAVIGNLADRSKTSENW